KNQRQSIGRVSLCAGSKPICPTALPDPNPAKAKTSDPSHIGSYLQGDRGCCFLPIASRAVALCNMILSTVSIFRNQVLASPCHALLNHSPEQSLSLYAVPLLTHFRLFAILCWE